MGMNMWHRDTITLKGLHGVKEAEIIEDCKAE